MFGGVTCLPGCFSMYRIKAPKGNDGYWVPILANPDIVEHYSENIVDTLHKKNLLLLGEDRYLTTLMLKTFPKRKMMFCPQAVSKTIVPDTFRVLLSQRRRWINSTIHNLAELLLVRDLCGTFCFSMQFVVFMELMGTLVLPAAISFTFYLIIISIIPHHQNTTIPLILLGIILGLPGLLIVLTSRKIAYVGWMFIYLLSLPVWNFALPAYAFWHFDDFSWGATRKVSNEKEGHHGDKEGEFDASNIVMKKWSEFERDRRWNIGNDSRAESIYHDSRPSPKRYYFYPRLIFNADVFLRNDDYNRYSMVSSSDPFASQPVYPQGPPSFENEIPNSQRSLLQLPAPLGRMTQSSSPVSNFSAPRSSEDTISGPDSSQQRLVSPQADYSTLSLDTVDSSIESHMSRIKQGVLRQSTINSQYPVETQNPYRNSQPYTVMTSTYEEPYAYAADFDDSPSSSSPFVSPNSAAPLNRNSRGFTLSDSGPVPGPEGVRRVARPQARRSTQNPPPSGGNGGTRYARTTSMSSGTHPLLPPGAAPPNVHQYR